MKARPYWAMCGTALACLVAVLLLCIPTPLLRDPEKALIYDLECRINGELTRPEFAEDRLLELLSSLKKQRRLWVSSRSYTLDDVELSIHVRYTDRPARWHIIFGKDNFAYPITGTVRPVYRIINDDKIRNMMFDSINLVSAQ